MPGRLRKPLTFILYLIVGLLFAPLLYWLGGLFWSAEYQELRAKFFWPFIAASALVFVAIYYQEAKKENEKDSEDDS